MLKAAGQSCVHRRSICPVADPYETPGKHCVIELSLFLCQLMPMILYFARKARNAHSLFMIVLSFD